MRRHRRFARGIGAALAAGLLAGAFPAHAEESTVTGLLLKALELRREHHNEEALATCEKAFALSPTPAVRAQRGLAEQASGRWVLAERDLTLAMASDDPWVRRHEKALEEAHAVIRQHVAWLTVDVDAEGAEIVLDGERLMAGVESAVAAGVFDLRVSAEGYVAADRRVGLVAGEHVREHVSLVSNPVPALAVPSGEAPLPLRADVTIPAVPPERGPGRPMVLPLTLGTLGIASLATGAWFGVRTFNDVSQEHLHCQGGCTQTARNDYEGARLSSVVSTAACGAGVALIAGGTLVWLLGRHAPKAADGAVSVLPTAGQGFVGLSLQGRL